MAVRNEAARALRARIVAGPRVAVHGDGGRIEPDVHALAPQSPTGACRRPSRSSWTGQPGTWTGAPKAVASDQERGKHRGEHHDAAIGAELTPTPHRLDAAFPRRALHFERLGAVEDKVGAPVIGVRGDDSRAAEKRLLGQTCC